MQKKNGGKYMEANSQVKILEDQIRECYGRLVWTYTTHQKCVDILEKKSKRIKMFPLSTPCPVTAAWPMTQSALT